MKTLDRYRELLEQLRHDLARYRVATWPGVLGDWIRELDQLLLLSEPLPAADIHLRRTRRALGGMGSIGDVVICPEAGDNVEEAEIHLANERLLSTVRELDAAITSLLGER